MSSESDATVVRLWRKVLGSEAAFDDPSNFFAEGGDSLLAVEIVTAIEDEMVCQVDLEVLFLDGTLGALKQAVAKDMAAGL